MMTIKPCQSYSLQVSLGILSKWLKATAVLLVVGFIAACSSTDVRMKLSASADLNTNSFNEPLPVIVRIYQLADIETFQSATFDQLWKADELILGSNLLHKQELTIKPKANVEYEFVQAEHANYVGIFVLFRNHDKDGWRWVHKLSTGTMTFDSDFDVKLVKNQILYREQ